MHQDTADPVADLRSRLGIEVEVNEVRSHGFDGAETLMYVITAVAGGVSSGMLSKMGGDLWDGIRKVAGALRRRNPAKIVVVVIQDTPDGPVRFRCDLVEDLTPEQLAEAFREAVSRFESGSTVEVVETNDGTEVRIVPVKDGEEG